MNFERTRRILQGVKFLLWWSKKNKERNKEQRNFKFSDISLMCCIPLDLRKQSEKPYFW